MSNSQPLNNDSLYWAYGEANPHCEVAFYAGLYMKDGKLIPTCLGTEITTNLQRHHIWSVSGERPDLRSNLITTTLEMHNWLHAHQRHARVIAVTAKLRKLSSISQPEEFTLEEAKIASGRNVYGIISGLNFGGEAMFEKMQQECLRRLNELKAEAA